MELDYSELHQLIVYPIDGNPGVFLRQRGAISRCVREMISAFSSIVFGEGEDHSRCLLQFCSLTLSWPSSFPKL